jgi:hypothetical protein
VKKTVASSMQIEKNIPPIEGMRVGRIVSVNESGSVFVDFPGNAMGPITARITTAAKTATIGKGNPAGREVLLAFENNDPKHPVIVDTIYSLIEEISETTFSPSVVDEPQEVTVNGKRICIDADCEIVLKCGKSSITLTRAGKVIIKGEYVLSQSSGENRIRGGSVAIN